MELANVAIEEHHQRDNREKAQQRTEDDVLIVTSRQIL